MRAAGPLAVLLLAVGLLAGCLGGENPGSPVILLNTSSLDFGAGPDGTNPPPQSFYVTNVGGGALHYEVVIQAVDPDDPPPPWLSATPAGGVVKERADEIHIRVDVTGLSEGDHLATITVRALNADALMIVDPLVPVPEPAGTLRVEVRLSVACSNCYYVNNGTFDADDVYTTRGGAVFSAANDGRSPGTPVSSLAAIFDNYDLRGGERIFVDAGTYALTENISLEAGDNGTAAAPVEIIGVDVPGKTVLDRGGRMSGQYALQCVGTKHLVVRGITFRNAQRGVFLSGCEDIQFEDCAFSANDTAGLHAAFGTTDLRLVDCAAENNGGKGLWFDGCSNVTVKHCTVRNNGSIGLLAFGCDGVELRRNTVNGQPNGIVVENCLQLVATDNLVYRNFLGGIELRSGTTDAILTNNTLHANGLAELMITGASTGARVFNHLFAAEGSAAACVEVSIDSADDYAADHNDFYPTSSASAGRWDGTDQPALGDWQGASGVDGNSISTDPLFVDVLLADYRLQLGSPAVDTGQNDAPGIAAEDLDGQDRIIGSTVDLGAFEQVP